MPEGTVLDADGNDPFSRRKTESRNYWATRRKGAGELSTDNIAVRVFWHVSSPPPAD